MGFADGYLLKNGVRERLIADDPDPNLKIIITIPCYNESGLIKSLDSLFLCDTTSIRSEVLIFINAPGTAAQAIHDQNLDTFNQAHTWIQNHQSKSLRYHLIIDNNLPRKHAGVGLARKTLMDEAVRRFNLLRKADGIILSLDADALVASDYLVKINDHFKENQKTEGCSIYFEHPVSGDEFDAAVYNAVIQYELHLRYYVRAVRDTGYPFAFHTVGSCFGVRAETYCKHGGMNRRQGGEDFYFIQKVAQNGHFSDCTSTCVTPSPRPSDRVPFGTGPVVRNLISNPQSEFKTFHPESFAMLNTLFDHIELLHEHNNDDAIMKGGHPILRNFLDAQAFHDALNEIRANAASPQTFKKRFWRYFNMFRILKFLHHARDNGMTDQPVVLAANLFLQKTGIASSKENDLKSLLKIYRNLDRGIILNSLR